MEDTAHYYDDLYQVLYTIYLKKFNIDRRKFNYSALIRSKQLDREKALERINNPNYPLFNMDGLRLCLERLISYEFFEVLKMIINIIIIINVHRLLNYLNL